MGAVARIPDSVKQDILARTDLVALVRETVELRRSGSSFVGLCPFHAEKTPSFHVQPTRRIFHCFGCGVGGDAFSYVMERDGLTFPEVLRVLGARVGVRVEEFELTPAQAEEERRRQDQRSWTLQANEMACVYWERCLAAPDGQLAREYVQRRGLVSETVALNRIGYAPDSWDGLVNEASRRRIPERVLLQAGLARARSSGGCYDAFRDRIVTPVFDVHGRVVAFSARALSDEEGVAKYINSSETPVYRKGECLFGIRSARTAMRRAGHGVLVEGNFDVLSLQQAGVAETVAPLGTALTLDQLKLLRRFTSKVYFCYDGDRAGKAAAMKAAPLVVQAELDARLVRLPDGEDPDSFVRSQGVEELRKLIKQAVPLIQARIYAVAPGRGAPVEARLQAWEELKPILAAVRHPIARDHYLALASEALELDEARIRRYSRQSVRSVEQASAAPSQRAPVPTGRPDPTARLLLGLLLDFPSFVPQAERADVLTAVREPPVLRALSQLVVLTEEEGPVDATRLLGALEGPDGEVVRQILAAPGAPLSEDEGADALEDVLQRLRRRGLAPERGASRAMRELQTAGDEEAIRALLRQRESRAKERHGL